MECQNLSYMLVGTACPNFVEKTFTGGSKTAKFMNVFSLKSFALYCTVSRECLARYKVRGVDYSTMLYMCSLNVFGDVVNFGAVFVGYDSPLSGSSVSTKHYTILQHKIQSIYTHNKYNITPYSRKG